jgi:hypothetical protein
MAPSASTCVSPRFVSNVYWVVSPLNADRKVLVHPPWHRMGSSEHTSVEAGQRRG